MARGVPRPGRRGVGDHGDHVSGAAGKAQGGDPRRVGPYRVRARIGAGGMGVVYLARRRHRTVAVKVLRVDLASSDAFRTRFEREIAAARRITGQGVPALLDADARAVRPWFATEFVPGETLEAFVAEHGALDGPALRAFAVGV